ncbi:hypothetical protein QJS04_geneDACA013926 [Acorus gramineus]|uniref:Uncharacterized protein n=1 Tax=Acorus gramineus TaxID=55184 RepID=A0AAV9AZQ6_ACOGR|nr:hypothetical protein QJS04_geneDACA013926 [Acorus gramineus]
MKKWVIEEGNLRRLTAMAKEQVITRPWILETVPLLVVVLIVAHVLALVYWIYRLATEKQPQRRKAH